IRQRAVIRRRSFPCRLGALARLLLFPDPGELTGIGGGPLVFEHVRVAADELLADAARDLCKIEPALLLGHARMEHHLEEQITQLLAQLVRLAALHRIGHLVGLLERIGRDGAESLLAIPGAAPLRVAQPRHERQERAHRLAGRAAAAHTRPSVQSLWSVTSIPAVAPQMLRLP